LIMASMVLPFFTSKKEDAPDFENMAKNFKEAQESGTEVKEDVFKISGDDETLRKYTERMVDVFQDMCDLGYI
jgi:hypothetical protein